jgi:radical SAM superfamily enzyme YgiQ (UPF0313 family)
MKKITYIYPAVGKKPGEKYIGNWKMEPLPISTLAGLTPEEYDIKFFDDRFDLIDYDTDTDLVGITVETYTALRAYKIASRFRERGIPVVLGGYHPTHLPDEAVRHGDAVVVGNAETVLAKVLDDAKQGRLEKVYRGTPGYSHVLPDRSIYGDREYLPLGLVETGRGCYHACEFCHISTYYGAKYIPRPIEYVIADIRQSDRKFFFLVDDNFIANPPYAVELCKELAKLNITWVGQGSIAVARNPELLYWLRKSGCRVLLIGFESLDENNLRQMNKAWSVKSSERDELVRRIHRAGISIYATFVFGFDHDTAETFERSVEFSIRHNFFFTAFNHLLPFPGTPLYRRLMAEGRMLSPTWWLDESFTYGDIPFQPAHMSAEELSERCVESRQAFFRYSSVLKRGIKLFGRRPPFSFIPIFFASNRSMGSEVNGRYRLPLGSGLDELPK